MLYVKSLAAPHTINTMPEVTLRALAEHGEIDAMLPHDGGDAEDVLSEFTRADIDLEALADQLQREGIIAFEKSWKDVLSAIAEKSARLKQTG